MKLRFKATQSGPEVHQIDGETINGIDLSPLEHGGAFVPTAATQAAGIRAAYRNASGVLHVTLTERVIAGRYPGRKAHWRGTGQEIDASTYDPNECHVVPTGMAGIEDYQIVWRDGAAPGESGWTVEMESEYA